jgi:mycofactocin precursor peptide peptidase
MAALELARRVWPGAATGDVLAVALGAVEQHGPHLPLGTDTRLAAEVVARLARLRDGVVVAPAIPYGASGEHQAFPGTVSIGTEATALLLLELGRSASCTFPHLLIVNGHGGNAEAVALAVQRLQAEGRSVLAWHVGAHGADAHAGRTETSMMLAVEPGDVALAAAEAGNTAPIAELLPAIRGASVREVSPNGVLGDPAGASAEEGEALLDGMAADLLEAVRRWLG